jgi:hypothetical protein
MKQRMQTEDQPLLKPNARIPPPSMNILMSRSSARTSYTEISPDVKPSPTTSIAGDCVRAVIAVECVWLGDERRLELGNLWMHVLG